MTKRALIVVVIVSAAAVACGRYFAPDRNLKETLTEQEIVGTWHLTQESLDLLVADGFEISPEHQYTLDLRSGGSCEFASVHDLFQGGEYVSAPCEWSLKHDTRGGSNIRKKNVLRLLINREGGTIRAYLNFARDAEDLLMWNYYGDPDSWEFMEYERRASDDAI